MSVVRQRWKSSFDNWKDRPCLGYLCVCVCMCVCAKADLDRSILWCPSMRLHNWQKSSSLHEQNCKMATALISHFLRKHIFFWTDCWTIGCDTDASTMRRYSTSILNRVFELEYPITKFLRWRNPINNMPPISDWYSDRSFLFSAPDKMNWSHATYFSLSISDVRYTG